MLLEKMLAMEAFHFLLVFARVGGFLLYVPFLAANYVPTWAKLCFGLSFAVLMTPLVSPLLPSMPLSALDLFLVLFKEITVGFFLGIFMFFLTASIEVAGHNVSMAIGLSNATAFDPTLNVQSTVITSFLSLLGLTIIAATGTHLLMIRGVIDSYIVFTPEASLPVGDMSKLLVETLASTFRVGIQISSPFIVFSIILQTGMGLLARLMPQLNILFLVMPAQIYLGAGLIMIALPVMMAWFMRYVDDSVMKFIG